MPCPRIRSAWTRQIPWMRRDATCTCRMTSVSQAWRIARRGCARTSSEIAGQGAVEHATRELRRRAIRGDQLDGREVSFWACGPCNNSAAFQWMASSASNSRIRRRAPPTQPAPQGEPRLCPWSTRSCRRQAYPACSPMPRPTATSRTGLPATIRSRTRCRNSPGSLVCPCCPRAGTATWQSSNPTPRNPGLTIGRVPPDLCRTGDLSLRDGRDAVVRRYFRADATSQRRLTIGRLYGSHCAQERPAREVTFAGGLPAGRRTHPTKAPCPQAGGPRHPCSAATRRRPRAS